MGVAPARVRTNRRTTSSKPSFSSSVGQPPKRSCDYPRRGNSLPLGQISSREFDSQKSAGPTGRDRCPARTGVPSGMRQQLILNHLPLLDVPAGGLIGISPKEATPPEAVRQVERGADGLRLISHALTSGVKCSSCHSAEVRGVDAVVRDLGHFHPFQAGGVADRLAQLRRRVAVGDDVEPVTVAAVLGHTPFVRGEQHTAVGVADPLDFDQSQIAGRRDRRS